MKYYGNSDRLQNVTTTPADQNTFVKFLASQNTIEPTHSKKQLFEEFTSRLKMNTSGEVLEKKLVLAEHCDRCNIAREELSDEGIFSMSYMRFRRIYVSCFRFSKFQRYSQGTQ